MSKRFPEFSRLFWQTLRPQRRLGLHPAMRERMWKPGQSGNPSGVSKAYREAMRQMAAQPVELSIGAEHTRRWRLRKQRGQVILSQEISPHLIGGLIRGGWPDESKRCDKEAIAAALVRIAQRAI
jgi:Family of unknown function (DUF5681)